MVIARFSSSHHRPGFFAGILKLQAVFESNLAKRKPWGHTAGFEVIIEAFGQFNCCSVGIFYECGLGSVGESYYRVTKKSDPVESATEK